MSFARLNCPDNQVLEFQLTGVLLPLRQMFAVFVKLTLV